ncbi:MAG: SH3 domain-containing protein [Clostridia bacterium]|nr:SH3 domain-containing protein [Clostridia bacterium]
MKRMLNQRKVLSLILIAAMVLASATTALAANDWSATGLNVAYYVTTTAATSLYTEANTTSVVKTSIAAGQSVGVISTDGYFHFVLYSSYYGYVPISACGTNSGVPTATTAGSVMYSTPFYVKASRTDGYYGWFEKGDVPTVISTSGEFSYVLAGGKYGYILTAALSSTPTNTTVSYYVTTSVSAPLYRSTDTTAGSLATVPANATVGVISTSGSYYYANYSGNYGYIAISACQGTSTGGGASYYVTTTQNTPLYQYASTVDGTYTTVPANTSVGVISTSGSYYRITYGGYTGYILTSACSTSTTGTGVSYYVTTNQSTVLYQYASTTDGTYTTVPSGASVGVISTSGSFYRAVYGGYTGYILTSACTSGAAPVTTTVSYYLMTQYATPLYKDSSTTGGTLATIAASRSVGVISTTYNGYYYVVVDGLYGFMPTTAFAATPAATIGTATTPIGNVATYGTVSIGATIYASDSTTSQALGRVSNAGTVSIISQTTSGFYYVRVGTYSGYIPTASVMVASDATVIPFSDETKLAITPNGVTVKKSGTIENCQNWVSLREAASSSSDRIAKVTKGSTVSIIETSGAYTKVTYAGTTGYILSSYIA